jgi:hypothetical protein
MKVKLIFLAISVFSIVVSISSCTDEMDNYNKGINIDDTAEYNKVPSDSLEFKYSMQSNSELMVLDRIICKNSVYVLDMTSQEASELMIPIEVYQEAVKRVEFLNKAPQGN